MKLLHHIEHTLGSAAGSSSAFKVPNPGCRLEASVSTLMERSSNSTLNYKCNFFFYNG